MKKSEKREMLDLLKEVDQLILNLKLCLKNQYEKAVEVSAQLLQAYEMKLKIIQHLHHAF